MKAGLETRIERYLAAVPAAISGQDGHRTLFLAAGKLVNGFGLDVETATGFLLTYYNSRCEPRWTEKEIRHKCEDAARTFAGRRGYLLKEAVRSATVRKPSLSEVVSEKEVTKRQAVETFREHYDENGDRFYESEIVFLDGRRKRSVYRRKAPDFYVLDGVTPTGAESIWLFDYRAGDDSPWHLVKRTNFTSGKNATRKRMAAFHWAQEMFVPGLGELPRVPFLLTELKEAESVFIVEGEKSAVKMNALLVREKLFPACIATCFFGGSGGWKNEYAYAEHFRHKDVAIIADNDEKGRDFAQRVAEGLSASASRVRIYADYPPAYQHGDDVVELIAREYESRKKPEENHAA